MQMWGRGPVPAHAQQKRKVPVFLDFSILAARAEPTTRSNRRVSTLLNTAVTARGARGVGSGGGIGVG